MKTIDADKLLLWMATAYEDSSHDRYEKGKKDMKSMVEALIHQGHFDPDNVPKINVGDRVTHEKYSSGIVTTISIFGKAYVSWDKPIITGSVPITELELLEDTNNGGN